jgi:hypothetical protein
MAADFIKDDREWGWGFIDANMFFVGSVHTPFGKRPSADAVSQVLEHLCLIMNCGLPAVNYTNG